MVWTVCDKVMCGFVARCDFVASACVDKPLAPNVVIAAGTTSRNFYACDISKSASSGHTWCRRQVAVPRDISDLQMNGDRSNALAIHSVNIAMIRHDTVIHVAATGDETEG